jgi:hypothetical protein
MPQPISRSKNTEATDADREPNHHRSDVRSRVELRKPATRKVDVPISEPGLVPEPEPSTQNQEPRIVRKHVEASMDKQEPNPASTKEPAEGSRENVNVGPERSRTSADEFDDEFQRKSGLEGKTDSGPEPDVFGRDIPPQD